MWAQRQNIFCISDKKLKCKKLSETIYLTVTLRNEI